MSLAKMVCGDATLGKTDLLIDNVNGLINYSDIALSSQSQELLAVFGNSISESLNNYGTWFARKSDGNLVFFYNGGVGGNTTEQMIARLDSIPAGTKTVLVMEATNDAASGVTASQHALNMKAIFEYIISKGMRPILIIAPPHDTPARSILVDQMNMFDYLMAQSLGVACFDIWSQFTNPTSGSWVSGASSDGTHPNPATEQSAGYSLQNKYANKKYYIPLPRNNANSGINPNSCFLTDANSDGVPDNWATNGSQTSKTLTQTTLALGNTWTTTWANTAVFMNSSRFNVVSGKRYLFVMRFSSSFTSGSTPLSVYLEYNTPVGSPAVDRVYFLREASVSVDDCTLTADFIVPAGVSTIRFAVNAAVGTYNLTVKIGQAQMFNLSDHTL